MTETPQIQNVLGSSGNHTLFTVWNFQDDMASENSLSLAFEKICALVINLNHSMATRFPGGEVSCVMGIGPEAWELLSLALPAPKELSSFSPIEGQKYTAVATRGDLHFHLRGHEQSICYDMALEITNVLAPVATCQQEVHGFRYWDGRSILGFVDGTENPQGAQRSYYGLIGDADPDYQGGSYLFVQKYLHDLKAFKALSVQEQEKVFGRYRESDVEMPSDIKPSNAHTALANVGDDLKIIRDNMPFGSMSTNEMGTYFIAYASTFTTVEKMLVRMFVGDPPGNYDRLLDFSKAVTGSLFFVPTLDMLERMAEGGFKRDAEALSEDGKRPDGNSPSASSLQIGSLRQE